MGGGLLLPDGFLAADFFFVRRFLRRRVPVPLRRRVFGSIILLRMVTKCERWARRSISFIADVAVELVDVVVVVLAVTLAAR